MINQAMVCFYVCSEQRDIRHIKTSLFFFKGVINKTSEQRDTRHT